LSLELHVSWASTLGVRDNVFSIVARARRIVGLSEASIVAPKPPPVHVTELAALHKQRSSVPLSCLLHLNRLLDRSILPVEELISEGLKLHVLKYLSHVLGTVLFANRPYSNPLIIWIDFVIFFEKRIGVDRCLLARLSPKQQIVPGQSLERVHHWLPYKVYRVFAVFLEDGTSRQIDDAVAVRERVFWPPSLVEGR